MYRIRYFEGGKEIIKEFATKKEAVEFSKNCRHMCLLQDENGKNIAGVLYRKKDR